MNSDCAPLSLKSKFDSECSNYVAQTAYVRNSRSSETALGSQHIDLPSKLLLSLKNAVGNHVKPGSMTNSVGFHVSFPAS